MYQNTLFMHLKIYDFKKNEVYKYIQITHIKKLIYN